MPKKYLIAMLWSNGDCVMVTALAHQLKTDEPDCHITWVIGFKCRQVIDNNPYVDAIWEVFYTPDEDIWERVKHEGEIKKGKGEFDEIFYCPIFPDHRERFDGTTRSSTFRAFTRPLTVPVTPVIKLYPKEVETVKDFCEQKKIADYKHVILCECAPSSAQSFLNPEKMIAVANAVNQQRPDTIFIISSHLKLEGQYDRIIDASGLSYRENAELSKYCTFLVGCSSGITWLLTSDWAKTISTIQYLNKPVEKPLNFASVKYDFKYYGLPAGHIIESTESRTRNMVEMLLQSLNNFEDAKKKYDEELIPHTKMFRLYLTDMIRFKKLSLSCRNSFIFFRNFKERNKRGTGFSILYPFFLIEAIIRRFQIEFNTIIARKSTPLKN